MKIGVQLFVTARKAITVVSSDHERTGECMEEIDQALHDLQLEEVKKDLIELFGVD